MNLVEIKMPKNAKKLNWLQINVIRIARVHFWLVGAFAGLIIVYHASKLITPEAVLGRWTTAAIMMAVTTLVWYAARQSSRSGTYYTGLVYILILLDIYVASSLIYAERGMASRAVALYLVPIIVSAALLRPRAIFAAASLSTAAYCLTAIRYFVVNFNEGYMVELYSTLALYSAIFFVVAGLLSIIIRSNSSR